MKQVVFTNQAEAHFVVQEKEQEARSVGIWSLAWTVMPIHENGKISKVPMFLLAQVSRKNFHSNCFVTERSGTTVRKNNFMKMRIMSCSVSLFRVSLKVPPSQQLFCDGQQWHNYTEENFHENAKNILFRFAFR